MPLTQPFSENKVFQRQRVELREFLYALRDHLDDHALICADPLSLKPKLYPFITSIRVTTVAALLDEARKTGLVRLRRGLDGQDVLHFPGCEQTRKRSMTSKHVPNADGQYNLLAESPPGHSPPKPNTKYKKEEKEGTSRERHSSPPDEKPAAANNGHTAPNDLGLLLKDIERAENQIKKELDRQKPDHDFIRGLRKTLENLRAKIRVANENSNAKPTDSNPSPKSTASHPVQLTEAQRKDYARQLREATNR